MSFFEKLLVCTVAVLAFFTTPLAAQKAEALRIEFARGSSSKVVSGTLHRDVQAEYAVGAKANQKLTLQLTAAPQNSFKLTLRSPEAKDLPLTEARQNRWTSTLPLDGDYEIWVVCKVAGSSTARYKLRVTIH